MISVLEQLRAGRERIARGWCQHDFARKADGTPTDGLDPEAVTWCAYGAAHDDQRVERVLESALNEFAGTYLLATWNDKSDRTQADVLALYDRAIAAVEGTVAA